MFGTVEFFNNPKGWGIILGKSGESFFVHHRDISDMKFFPEGEPSKYRTLNPGQDVSFNIKETDKEFNMAVDVTLLETVITNDS